MIAFDMDFCHRNATTTASAALRWVAGKIRSTNAEDRRRVVDDLRTFFGQPAKDRHGTLVTLYRHFLPQLWARYIQYGHEHMVDSGRRVFTHQRVRLLVNKVVRADDGGEPNKHPCYMPCVKMIAELMFVHAFRLHASAARRAEVRCVRILSPQAALDAKFAKAETDGTVIDLTNA